MPLCIICIHNHLSANALSLWIISFSFVACRVSFLSSLGKLPFETHSIVSAANGISKKANAKNEAKNNGIASFYGAHGAPIKTMVHGQTTNGKPSRCSMHQCIHATSDKAMSINSKPTCVVECYVSRTLISRTRKVINIVSCLQSAHSFFQMLFDVSHVFLANRVCNSIACGVPSEVHGKCSDFTELNVTVCSRSSVWEINAPKQTSHPIKYQSATSHTHRNEPDFHFLIELCSLHRRTDKRNCLTFGFRHNFCQFRVCARNDSVSGRFSSHLHFTCFLLPGYPIVYVHSIYKLCWLHLIALPWSIEHMI